MRKDLEHRGGVEYGAARYNNPKRNVGEPGAAEIGAQLHELREALAQQAEIVRRLLEGMGIADSVVGRFGARAFDEDDRPLGPSPQERLWQAHKAEREADDLAGVTSEELKRHRSRHAELGQVEKSQAVAEVADALSVALAKMPGMAARANESGAETSRRIAAELLTATFTAETSSPDRRW